MARICFLWIQELPPDQTGQEEAVNSHGHHLGRMPRDTPGQHTCFLVALHLDPGDLHWHWLLWNVSRTSYTPWDLKELPVPSVTHIQDALEQHAVPDPPIIPRLHSQVGEPHTRDPKLVVGGIQALKLLVLFWCHEAWVGESNRRGMVIDGRRN